MSGRELQPVLEESKKFKGALHVDVEATVAAIGKALAEGGSVTLVARQGEISRAGMIIRMVEEQHKARVLSMRTENRKEKRTFDDKEVEINVLFFRTTFERNA